MALFWIAAVFCILILGISGVCFYIAFYEPRNRKNKSANAILPPGELYAPYREITRQWAEEVRAMPHEEFYIESRDGLHLFGKYYQCKENAPIEIMFHGYRGSAERDLSGGVRRAFALGHNVLIVDQRTAGKSEGNVITFGILERWDCVDWVNFVVEKFGSDVRIILTGISMGAATVLMAAGEDLPENVVGVLADCGYSSAREIIQKTIREMKLPVGLSYFFVRLGAIIFGRFDPDETSPLKAMERCNLPVIFIHGDADNYVPCAMSEAVCNACRSKKELVRIPGAGHGLAYPVAPEKYVDAMKAFFYPEKS
ncbi:MAG: prolyl oligopeptidase family serine peptidase [Clostridia bacterium]|nr:prolyl oligopeptidase family serine peptidase [Clostridia bacterium]